MAERNDIPNGLLELPRKKRLTEGDFGFTRGNSAAVVCATYETNEKSRRIADDATELLIKVMESDVCVHKCTGPWGVQIMEKLPNGKTKAKTEIRSRWIDPKYSKSVSHGALDAEPFYMVKFVRENKLQILPLLEFIDVRNAGKPGGPDKSIVEDILNPENPERQETLAFLKGFFDEREKYWTKRAVEEKTAAERATKRKEAKAKAAAESGEEETEELPETLE